MSWPAVLPTADAGARAGCYAEEVLVPDLVDSTAAPAAVHPTSHRSGRGAVAASSRGSRPLTAAEPFHRSPRHAGAAARPAI
jgi:hypothetical protein